MTRQRALRIGLIVVGSYVALVFAFGSFVVFQGQSHAERGVGEDEDWIVLTTKDHAGNELDSILAGVEVDGKLYVAANHWPRTWYYRAVENQRVVVEIQGVRAEYQAVPLNQAEHEQVVREYSMPLIFRFLTGFPPRRFLRLEQ